MINHGTLFNDRLSKKYILTVPLDSTYRRSLEWLMWSRQRYLKKRLLPTFFRVVLKDCFIMKISRGPFYWAHGLDGEIFSSGSCWQSGFAILMHSLSFITLVEVVMKKMVKKNIVISAGAYVFVRKHVRFQIEFISIIIQWKYQIN